DVLSTASRHAASPPAAGRRSPGPGRGVIVPARGPAVGWLASLRDGAALVARGVVPRTERSAGNAAVRGPPRALPRPALNRGDRPNSRSTAGSLRPAPATRRTCPPTRGAPMGASVALHFLADVLRIWRGREPKYAQ